MPMGVPPEFARQLAVTRKLSPPDPEEALLQWLGSVLDTSLMLANMKGEEAAKTYRALVRAHGISGPYAKYRLLVAQTCSDHVTPKMQAVYALAVSWAEASRIEPSDFAEFVRDQGGIKECAAKMRRSGGDLRSDRTD